MVQRSVKRSAVRVRWEFSDTPKGRTTLSARCEFFDIFSKSATFKGPTESSAPTAAVQFYDISSRNQSLDDLCGQEDEDKDDSGLYDLGAVFNGESRADEMAEDARHRADEAEDEEDLAA